MAKKAKKRSQEQRDFIKGKTNKVTISPDANKDLGYSPVLATAAGAGAHGGTRKDQLRRARKSERQRLRSGDWD